MLSKSCEKALISTSGVACLSPSLRTTKNQEFYHEPHEQGANLENGEIYNKYTCSRDKEIRGLCSKV